MIEKRFSRGRPRVVPRVLKEMELVRMHEPALEVLLSLIEGRHPAWAVVGGAPRAWMIGCPSSPRDLDLTVSGTAEDLDETVRMWLEATGAKEPGRTSFGGYELQVGEASVDIWPAQKTVGIERDRVSDSKLFRAVAKSAALSFDSCVVTSKGAIYERGFFRTWETGVLALNHWDPERKEGVARKAVWLCDTYNLIPDMRVQLMIQETLDWKYVAQNRGHESSE